ncbi:MAG: DNA recombination protein RmuC [Bdellovibrionia bacterium]
MEFTSLGVGLLFGAGLSLLLLRGSLSKHKSQSLILAERLSWIETEKIQIKALLESCQTQLIALRKKEASLEASLETEKYHFKERLEAQNSFMLDLKKQSQLEFESLAQQILETKSRTFNEQTEKNLEGLLRPLKERIGDFEKKVDATYKTEATERIALKTEVERLVVLNEKMTRETTQLTQALKGDSKFQGDWGELVLEKVLESSGLRANHEYVVQGEYRNDLGEKFRPDIIVNLPDSKHIVIDAKVSLKSYESYCSAEEPLARQFHLEGHLKSVIKHVEELSGKHYSKLKGLNSPEFVFLFMPIEPAFLLAAQNDSDLTTRAWKHGVAIVTATSLLTSLKTVASIWKLENQNKNALEIAHEGARLYDKFVGFLDDFEKIGKTFEVGQAQYSSAMGKLKDGPGNVFRKMEVLRDLGAAPNKRIRQDLLE